MWRPGGCTLKSLSAGRDSGGHRYTSSGWNVLRGCLWGEWYEIYAVGQGPLFVYVEWCGGRQSERANGREKGRESLEERVIYLRSSAEASFVVSGAGSWYVIYAEKPRPLVCVW